MSMKEAFDTFFEGMDNNSMKKLGKLPSIPYIEGKVSKDLLLLDTLDKHNADVFPLVVLTCLFISEKMLCITRKITDILGINLIKLYIIHDNY